MEACYFALSEPSPATDFIKFPRPFNSFYLQSNIPHSGRKCNFGWIKQAASRNDFVGWQNVKLYTLPRIIHLKFYSVHRAWQAEYEGFTALMAPSLPIFSYFSDFFFRQQLGIGPVLIKCCYLSYRLDPFFGSWVPVATVSLGLHIFMTALCRTGNALQGLSPLIFSSVSIKLLNPPLERIIFRYWRFGYHCSKVPQSDLDGSRHAGCLPSTSVGNWRGIILAWRSYNAIS